MDQHPGNKLSGAINALIVAGPFCLAVLVVIVLGTVALLRCDTTGTEGNRLPPKVFDHDIERYKTIDSSLIHYRQTQQWGVSTRFG